MRLSSSSFFPQIEPKTLKSLNRGSTQDENSFNKPRSSKLIQSTEIFGQPFKNKSNIMQIENKKRASITLGGSQKEIIKTLSEKLDEHQYLIDSRNLNIEELENQVKLIKVELQNEKVVVQVKTEQNLKLQDTNEKLNSRIRIQTQKFDDLQTKFFTLEQDFKSVKELEKTRIEQWSFKEQNYQKKVADLEAKLSSQKEDSKSKAKNALLEAQKQINELQAQIKSLEQNMEKAKCDLSFQEEKIKALDKDKLQYCSEALELRQKCSYQKDKLENQSNETHNLREQNKQLLQEQQSLKVQVGELQKQQLMLGDLRSQTQRCASDFEKQVLQNKDQIQRLEADIEGFKKQDKERLDEIKTLKLYIEKKDQKIVSLTDLLSQEKLQKGAESKDKEVILKEVSDLKEVIKSLNDNVNGIKQKEQIFKVNVDKLEKGEQEILKSLKCNYCSKFIKEPITIIPCGHSFCFQCKKAYAKDCIKCGPKVKVEAMYRNELLDDIIVMYKTMNSVKESLVSLIKMK